jgi:hypothetical protein
LKTYAVIRVPGPARPEQAPAAGIGWTCLYSWRLREGCPAHECKDIDAMKPTSPSGLFANLPSTFRVMSTGPCAVADPSAGGNRLQNRLWGGAYTGARGQPAEQGKRAKEKNLQSFLRKTQLCGVRSGICGRRGGAALFDDLRLGKIIEKSFLPSFGRLLALPDPPGCDAGCIPRLSYPMWCC